MVTNQSFIKCLLISFLASLCLPQSIFSTCAIDRPEQFLSDLEFLYGIFDTQYAPAEWKKELFDWDLAATTDKIKTRLLQNPPLDTKTYQRLLREYFLSFKDYHTHVSFYSTERASLPFSIKRADDGYFFVHIKRSAPENFFMPGDEILAIDDIPIKEYVEKLKKEVCGENSPLTDQSLAEMFATQRSARVGLEVPRGTICVSGKRQNGEQTEKIELEWKYRPEEIRDPECKPIKRRQAFLRSATNKPSVENLIRRGRLSPLQKILSPFSKSGKSHPFLLGHRNGFLPPLGEIVWQTDSDDVFQAYVFTSAGDKSIGYLRLPHYAMADYEALELRALIDLLQASTDMLLIDQMNNYGGYALFGYAFLSMITDYPLALPKERFSMTQKEIFEFKEMLKDLKEIKNDWDARKWMGDTLLGYPVNYQFVESLRSFCLFVIEEWRLGKTITDPFPDLGLERIEPHPKTRYTKPILMLINELSLSCGDYIPAILQDNKRALLIGQKTAGAGGYVKDAEYPNLLGIESISYTGSIIERSNGRPLENLGVEPDIPYTFNRRDMENQFETFTHFILNIIEGGDGTLQ